MASLHLVLACLVLAAPFAAAVPAPEVCTDATDRVIFPLPGGTIAPSCIVVDADGTVRFTAADVNVHDPGDAGAGGSCFRALIDAGAALGPGDEFAVRIGWDHERGRIVVNDRTCASNAFTPQPDGTIRVPFMCHLHSQMAVGTIVVRI